MNFFEHQHRARRNTGYLVFLFVLAVICIIAAISAAATAVFIFTDDPYPGTPPRDFVQTFLTIGTYCAPIIAFVIAMVSLIRVFSLSGNGRKVAQFLGAEQLPLQTDNLKDQQLRNVVEEMAIASGIPVPAIYVLRGESGINAFAAGTEPSNAVVGVTQGTLDELSRDQLQAVIAHEFSHIFNGDMKLNIHLMGTLAGILFIATIGEGILRGSSRTRSSSSKKGDGAGAIILFALALFIIGWIGVFFGRWIKAAISRQREFLADASAVQFTRNPQGLAGALTLIKSSGSRVSEAGAEEASHFFFGAIRNFSMFDTHPPIDERIGRLGKVELLVSEARTAKQPEPVNRVGNPKATDLQFAVSLAGSLSTAIRSSLHQPRAAMQFTLALLAKANNNADVLSLVDTEVMKHAEKIPEDQKLAIVDLAIPALRRLDSAEAAKLLQAVELLVRSDEKLDPFEIAALVILRRQLSPGHEKRPSRTRLSSNLSGALALVKVLALNCNPANRAQAAFVTGAERLGLSQETFETFWNQPKEESLAVEKHLSLMSHLIPNDKKILFEALWKTAHQDQKLSTAEGQYLRAFAEALEIPLPVMSVAPSI